MPVAAMLAVASKAAGFAGLVAVAFIAFEPVADVWAPVLGVLAILTMTIGNLIALQQRDIVRLLAYSSVAQAGYMLIPFGLAQPRRRPWSTTRPSRPIAVLPRRLRGDEHRRVRRRHRRQPTHRSAVDRRLRRPRRRAARCSALALATFLLSLGGAPPTVGLWAKFAILEAVTVDVTVFGVVLAAFLVINSVIAFFYYLKVVKTVWIDAPRVGAPRRCSPASTCRSSSSC